MKVIALLLQQACSEMYTRIKHRKPQRPSGQVFFCVALLSLYTSISVALGATPPHAEKDDAQTSPLSKPAVKADTEHSGGTKSRAAQICKQPPGGDDAIAQTQDYLQTIGCRTAFWIDGIGGATASASAARRTNGYLRLSTEFTEYGGFNIKLKGQLDSELPYLEQRLSAFVGRAPENTGTRTRSSNFYTDNLFSQATDDDEWLVGLGYKIPRLDKFDTSVKVGITSLSLPKLFIQATGRAVIHDSPTSLSDALIRPFWTNRDGAGLTLQASISKAMAAHNYIVRLAPAGTISEKTNGLNWRVNFTVFQRISETTGLAWQLRAAGETDAAESLAIYGAGLSYQRPLGKLLSQWRISYDFPSASPDEVRAGSAGLSLELTLPFGG